MTEELEVLRSDEELLSLARAVLIDNGFAVEMIHDRVEMLLAENRYFVIGLIAPGTIRHLLAAESSAFEALERRLASSHAGPKKWDTYLVMLTQERPADDDDVTRGLFAINHDTSHMRRMAHTDVAPKRSSVLRALSAFIEPVSVDEADTKGDALLALTHALMARGIPAVLATRAVTVFAQGGALDDVL
jgi:hypothetical protein